MSSLVASLLPGNASSICNDLRKSVSGANGDGKSIIWCTRWQCAETALSRARMSIAAILIAMF